MRGIELLISGGVWSAKALKSREVKPFGPPTSFTRVFNCECSMSDGRSAVGFAESSDVCDAYLGMEFGMVFAQLGLDG